MLRPAASGGTIGRVVKLGTARSRPAASFALDSFTWQVWFVPLSDDQRDHLFEAVVGKAREVARRMKLHDFSVDHRLEDGERLLLITNELGPDGDGDPMRLEVGRDRLGYVSEGVAIDSLRNHLLRAKPLLVATMTKDVEGRLLRSQHAYSLTLSLPADKGRPNLASLGMAYARGVLEPLPVRGKVGRIDLKWGFETTIADAGATVWIDLTAAGNRSHSEIDVRIVVQSASDDLPTASWTASVDQVHDDTWPVVTAVMDRLLAMEAAHGNVSAKDQAVAAKATSKKKPPSAR